MRLHVFPLIVLLMFLYWQGYTNGYYKHRRDQWYGLSLLKPAFVSLMMIGAYYLAYGFFKVVG